MAGGQRRLVRDAVGHLELVHELGVLVVFEPVAAIALPLLLEEAIVCPRGHCFLLCGRAGRASLPSVARGRRPCGWSAAARGPRLGGPRGGRAARGAGESRRTWRAAGGLGALRGAPSAVG